MKEIWKHIDRYHGKYQISSLGRIRSLTREVTYKDGRKHIYRGQILKPSISWDGYKKIALFNKGHAKTFYVHRLVAKAFIINPENKKTVNHKNFIKTDNNVLNLEWATHKENSQHYFLNKQYNESTKQD